MDKQSLQDAMAVIGYKMPPPDRMYAQMDVLASALMVYEDRSGLRGDLWKEFGPEDTLHHMKSKLARVDAMVGHVHARAMGQETLTPDAVEQLIEEAEDDALDLINYAAFLVRRLRREGGMARTL